MPQKWIFKFVTALVWALAAASAVFWGLRISQGSTAAPLSVAAEPLPSLDASALARLLGQPEADATPQASSSRLALVGVIAEGSRGVALLSVDGKPPRPVAVGDRIDDNLMLKAVGARYAEVGAGNSSAGVQRLQMPAQTAEAMPAGLTIGPAPTQP